MSEQDKYLQDLRETTDDFFANSNLREAVDLLHSCHARGNHVFTMGNGGSAAIAQHFSVDWSKGIYELTGKSLKTTCLSSNFSVHSAAANDISFVDSYSFLLEMLADQGDVAVIISSSGKSPNMVNAATRARELGIKTICLSGFGGGKLGTLGDVNLNLQTSDMQVIEDVHGFFGHYLLKSFRFEKIEK
jgi:phosphoheptose isomerase